MSFVKVGRHYINLDNVTAIEDEMGHQRRVSAVVNFTDSDLQLRFYDNEACALLGWLESASVDVDAILEAAIGEDGNELGE